MSNFLQTMPIIHNKIILLSTLVVFNSHLLTCSVSTDENSNSVLYDDDIENSVGYGEDCSNEGPFCDVRQHLSCDFTEEVCICDDKNGYVHVGNLELIPSLFEDDSEGSVQNKICMKSSDLEYKLEKLVNITKKIKDFADIMRKYQKYLPKKYQDLFKEEL